MLTGNMTGVPVLLWGIMLQECQTPQTCSRMKAGPCLHVRLA